MAKTMKCEICGDTITSENRVPIMDEVGRGSEGAELVPSRRCFCGVCLGMLPKPALKLVPEELA